MNNGLLVPLRFILKSNVFFNNRSLMNAVFCSFIYEANEKFIYEKFIYAINLSKNGTRFLWVHLSPSLFYFILFTWVQQIQFAMSFQNACVEIQTSNFITDSKKNRYSRHWITLQFYYIFPVFFSFSMLPLIVSYTLDDIYCVCRRCQRLHVAMITISTDSLTSSFYLILRNCIHVNFDAIRFTFLDVISHVVRSANKYCSLCVSVSYR